jgi:hypothetical protein
LAGEKTDCPHCQQPITLTVPPSLQPYNFWVPSSWVMRIPLLLLHAILSLIAVGLILSGEIGIGVVFLLMGLAVHCALMVLRKFLTTLITERRSLPSDGNPTINAVLQSVMANRKMLRNFAFGGAASGILFMVLFGIPDSMAFFALLWFFFVTGLFLQFSPKVASQPSHGPTASPRTDWLTPFLNRFPKRKLIRIAGVVAGVCLLILITPKLYRGIQEFGQARDPVMRQRTKEAWQQVQTIEMELARQGETAGVRAYAYSQLNLHKVDPQIIAYVTRMVELAREYQKLDDIISNELRIKTQSHAETAQAMQLLGGVVGLLASGESRSLPEIQRNLSAGIAFGQFSGQAVNSFQTDGMWNEIKQKYGAQLDAFNASYKQLVNDRQVLATTLSKKYGEPFMTAF